MRRLYQARLKELYPPVSHECSSRYCDPQNETALIRRGLLQGPPQCPEFLYLCKFGQVHACDESVCMVEEACRVSGLTMGVVNEYSSYDPNDSRTWGTESAPEGGASVPHPRRKRKRPERYTQAENLIETLLFTSAPRKRVISEWNRQRDRNAKKYKNAHVLSCVEKRVPINMIRLAMIEHKYRVACPTKPHVERDMDRLHQYVMEVCNMCERVAYHHPDEKICTESVALAYLYKKRQGSDPYLAENLPYLNDLVKFGVDRKKLGRGEKLIMRVIDVEGWEKRR